MIVEVNQNSSAENTALARCQNCQTPAVVEDQELKKCCDSPKFKAPKPSYRYVNFCCQKTVELAPERFDVYICYVCEKARIIVDEGVEVCENMVVFGTRNLTKQEAKLIKKNKDLEEKLTIVNEELRLAKVERKQNSANVLSTAVTERRIDLLKKELSTLATEYIAVSNAKSIVKSKNTDDIPIVKRGKVCKKTVNPVKKIWNRIVGQKTWTPAVSL